AGCRPVGDPAVVDARTRAGSQACAAPRLPGRGPRRRQDVRQRLVEGTRLVVVFALAATLSLGASALLVTRLERIGERLGLTEAMLGLLAALAADGPEITSSITAMARGQGSVGVGVVFGSNAFNLAALLGLSAI